jgi:hypothetical protein
MGPVKIFDPLGLTDLLSGILLFFTVSPIPTGIAQIHAAFLIYKGLGSYIRYLPLPMPVFYMGAFADLISAAILLVGTPPVLADYSVYLAGVLLLKGVWTSLAFMT